MLEQQLEMLFEESVQTVPRDIVGLADGLLRIAVEEGLLAVRPVATDQPGSLIVKTNTEECEIHTGRPLLRAICARLATVASRTLGTHVSPYGAEICFPYRVGDAVWMAAFDFRNHGEYWFELRVAVAF